MRIQLFAQTTFSDPWIDVRHDSHVLARKPASAPGPARGWHRFDLMLTKHRNIRFSLFEETKGGQENWEAFQRELILSPGGSLPERIWMLEGSDCILRKNPFAQALHDIRIHCITQKKFINGSIYIWTPQRPGTMHTLSGSDEYGPYFDLSLDQDTQHAFNFKFVRADGTYEEDYANRTWSSAYGETIWAHSNAAPVTTSEPVPKRLIIHLKHGWETENLWMHLWQGDLGTLAGSDYIENVQGMPGPEPGWTTFEKEGLHKGLSYGFMFTKSPDPAAENQNLSDWEDTRARRFLSLDKDEEYYTLEGDPFLFLARPEADRNVDVVIAGKDPGCPLDNVDSLQAWINNGRSSMMLPTRKLQENTWRIQTYPGIVTSFRFGSQGRFEDREHRISQALDMTDHDRLVYTVIGRKPLLTAPPPQDLFQDPPYWITRQGVVEEEGFLRFAIHAPWASRVRLLGEWMGDESGTKDLKSTLDGALWWAQIPVDEIVSGLHHNRDNDYHGARYQFLLNDIFVDRATQDLNGGKRVQDTAAQWVDTSDPYGWSRLVNHHRYQWKADSWERPGFEYLQVFQLHPDRFTRRNQTEGEALPPLEQVAREIEREDGFIRNLGPTAILLMPVSESGSAHTWGYDPSYYYAVEDSYGGPDKLKSLVDTCHQHGIAVLLDVVFNHAGVEDNILWENVRESYLDGDTSWGRLINFDHPQCRDFFAKNLTYWIENYRIDGFRFDHTKTIIEGHDPAFYFIREPGTGGGWEFLQYLHDTVQADHPRTLFMAEQLPNDWSLTGDGGPMDSQWCDDFHDRMIDICTGHEWALEPLGQSMLYGHTRCSRWFEVTNYSESHDEVGNVNNRIARLGGPDMAKVSGAVTMLSRSIPMFFMGQESAETAQFHFHSNASLDLDHYESNSDCTAVRNWWKRLMDLRRNNPEIQGPSPIAILHDRNMVLTFSRGEGREIIVLSNFGHTPLTRRLDSFGITSGIYRELVNSTWAEYRIGSESMLENGGWSARLNRSSEFHLPAKGTIILERI